MACFSKQTEQTSLPSKDDPPLPVSKEKEGRASQLQSLEDCLKKDSWSITRPHIFDLLEPAETVLVAGCGGGYDITSGLPLYFSLRKLGKKVHLANLSFTDLTARVSTTYCEMCVKVTHDMQLKRSTQGYFPEYYLSQWFWEKFGEDVAVFAFDRQIGVTQLSRAYRKICSELKVDAVVLVDGGTDSLMFGYEEAMGTPVEDQTSITAVSSLEEVSVKLLACIGFGVDHFHGVSHGLFLENVATLEKTGGYFGCFSVPQYSTEGRLYIEGYTAIAKCMQPSIVCASITDAMQGHFGNHHSTYRTGNSQLFINPLMPLYWTFDLAKVVEQIPYIAQLLKTESAFEVMKVIHQHQDQATKKDQIRKPIPLPM